MFILQVRNGSSRLPNKMSLPFYYSKTIPEIIISRIKEGFPEIPFIIATTTNNSDDSFVELADKMGIHIYRGSENNVLNRFLGVRNLVSAKNFIRVCGDNPFIDIDLTRQLVENWKDEYDYLTYMIDGKPSMKTSFGFFCEMASFDSLEKTGDLTNDKYYLEHVTNYIYTHEKYFNIKWLDVNSVLEENPYLRFTVDTQIDFEIAKSIFEVLMKQGGSFNYIDAVNYAKYSGLDKLMKTQVLNNQK